MIVSYWCFENERICHFDVVWQKNKQNSLWRQIENLFLSLCMLTFRSMRKAKWIAQGRVNIDAIILLCSCLQLYFQDGISLMSSVYQRHFSQSVELEWVMLLYFCLYPPMCFIPIEFRRLTPTKRTVHCTFNPWECNCVSMNKQNDFTCSFKSFNVSTWEKNSFCQSPFSSQLHTHPQIFHFLFFAKIFFLVKTVFCCTHNVMFVFL